MKQTKNVILSNGSTLVLRLALIVIAAIMLALCAFALPATWRAVPGEYPGLSNAVFYIIISGLYVAAIPFFIALFQAFKLLKYIDNNKAFSNLSVRALQIIAYCGIAVSTVFVALSPFFFAWGDYDDAPGLIVINMIFVGASFTVAVFAAVMKRLLSQAIDIKNENDLTV